MTSVNFIFWKLVSTFAFIHSFLLTPPFSTVFISKRFNVGHVSSFSITLDTKWGSMEDFWAEKTDLKPGFQIALQTPFLMRFRLIDLMISGAVDRLSFPFAEYLHFSQNHPLAAPKPNPLSSQIALQPPFLMRFRLMDTRISGVVRRFPPKFCEYSFFTPLFWLLFLISFRN